MKPYHQPYKRINKLALYIVLIAVVIIFVLSQFKGGIGFLNYCFRK